ncbi:MAG TPA: MarR family transcriptional regulator [Solirubrobacteraceae bacterium]|nr:MarR family transcriptional regulator [Solirubrobacteraceae bacterium]
MTAAVETTVPQALGRLRVELNESFERVSRELGLSAQQAELLCAAMRPAAVGDVARVLHCDRSNVTRLADRVAERGLLTRRPGDTDGRVTVLELTPEGDLLARRFIAALESELDDLLATWTERRKRDAVRLLGAVSDALRAAAA